MKLFIGICNSQYEIPGEFFWSYINIKSPYETKVFRSKHPWDVVRNNRIIDNFLKSDCDILVKMDIDQRYPENYFEKLVPLVEKYMVVGPLIYDRCEVNGHIPLAFSRIFNDGKLLQGIDLTGRTGVIDIKYCHTNLFYHRKVLEQIKPPWYEAYLSEDGLDRANHVDYDFLDKIHAAGYQTFIDLDTVVAHRHIRYINKNLTQGAS